MAILPPLPRPHAVLADAQRIWRSSTARYKLVFGALSIGITSIIVTGFILESRWGVLPEGPQIIYAEDFPANRTEAQIREDQWKDAAERRKAMDEHQREWKKVDDALTRHGI